MKSTVSATICIVGSFLISQAPASAQDRDAPLEFGGLTQLKERSDFLISEGEITTEALLEHAVRSQETPAEGTVTLDSKIPTFVPGAVILEIEPGASAEAIQSYLKKNNLQAIEIYDTIGQIKAAYDFSEYFKDDGNPLTPPKTESEKILGVINGLEGLKQDGVVSNATPDAFIGKFEAIYGEANVEMPDIAAADTLAEVEDWGLTDVEAAAGWARQTGNSGIVVGVLDTGFAPHEDISFLAVPPAEVPVSDHGNHVAGIMCARHNGVGVKGVLKDCLVAKKTASFDPVSADVDPILHFYTRFSQISSTFNEFIPEAEGPRVFNVSLGYNWRGNFDINPDEQSSAGYRALVQSQGEMLIRVYAIAQERGKAIFSAAGNDSHGLATPRTAKYASPFNWAAIEARARGKSFNGVVVEAHDSAGRRATFSNTGGHISCPGVNIISTIALDTNRKVRNNLYGRMSGTSMASPYCAASYGLLYTIFPGKTPAEIVGCMAGSDVRTNVGTPMLKLSKAISQCDS